MTGIGLTSRVRLHPLAIRESDDDPDTFVVGRLAGGGFVELPGEGVEAIRLLDSGLIVDAVEDRLAQADERPDVVGLLESLVELHWVATVDGRPLPDPIGAARVQFRWLRPGHLRWLFSLPVLIGYAVLLGLTAIVVVRQPGLLPGYRDFFWTDYVGLATLVNTLLFLAGAAVHETMHLAAARALDLPARIGLGTRLNNLALQTDVSAAWAVPRRQRYRIYLVGMVWDSAAAGIALLILAIVGPGPLLHQLLSAYILVAIAGLILQTQIYMRTDLYFVLLDLLRCGDLFHDGLGYARYLGARVVRAVRRLPAPDNPARELPDRERRGVRIYAPLVIIGSAGALGAYAFFGVPILVETIIRAISAISAAFSGGSVPRAIDGGVVLAVEWTLQALFLITFYRSHPAWFGRGSRNRVKEVISHA